MPRYGSDRPTARSDKKYLERAHAKLHAAAEELYRICEGAGSGGPIENCLQMALQAENEVKRVLGLVKEE